MGQQKQDSILWRIEMENGNRYTGTIIEQNSEEILFQEESLGVITLKTKNLISLEKVQPKLSYQDRMRTEHLQPSRYFFAPTGYELKAGEGYYQNVWILSNQARMGIKDNFSIGMGTVTFPPTPFWLTPKYSIPLNTDNINLDIGALLGTALPLFESGFAGTAYGVATIGGRNRNMSFGLGHGFIGQGVGPYSLNENTAPISMFTISGINRLSKKGYLVSENFFVTTQVTGVGMLTLGGRTVWEGISLDYGGGLLFFQSPERGFSIISVPLPLLGISVPFRNQEK